eukprot:TRINITY_DN18253_c0_g1_i1.p1 TRINITY_DN18253_c0_g1~~TRINITY_DN18253_c0_g1_i1.p1  ORF type:complete len:493 (+),score=188.33 TRINITY_DN18253_c0_g1_i1:49-1479(+)
MAAAAGAAPTPEDLPAAAAAAPAAAAPAAGAAPAAAAGAAGAAPAASSPEIEAQARKWAEQLKRKRAKPTRFQQFLLPAAVCGGGLLAAAASAAGLVLSVRRWGPLRPLGALAAAAASGALVARHYWRPRDAADQLRLGFMYHEGTGVERDVQEAALLFKLAADQGSAKAQHNYAVCCLHGEGVPQSEETARRYFRLAADQDEPSAMLSLARLLLGGSRADGPASSPRSAGDAVSLLQRAMESKEGTREARAEAAGVLAEVYETGLGVPKDVRKAAMLLATAAASSPAAASRLGVLLLDGCGDVRRDPQRAAKLLAGAADAGVREAKFSLAHLLSNGDDGVDADPKRAAELYASCNGDTSQPPLPESLFEEALLYISGRGVDIDMRRAAGLMKRAAACEEANAAVLYNLAEMYLEGEGLEADAAEAARLYRLAAEQGDADSCLRLSELYQFGEGVAADQAESARWARLAEECGREE